MIWPAFGPASSLEDAMVKHRKTIVMSSVIAVASYFILTWFFFGSSHPCGILEARWKPYSIEAALKLQEFDILLQQEYASSLLRENKFPEDLTKKLAQGKATREERAVAQSYRDAMEMRTDVINEINRLRDELQTIPQEVSEKVRLRAWSLTPAQCLWEAIVWRAPTSQKGETKSSRP